MKKLFAAASALALVAAQSANAALPPGVTDAIDTAGTDAAVVGGAVLVVPIGIAAFKFIRKAL